jgi:hypothetical protein
VKAPATSHEVRLAKIEAWPESGGRHGRGTGGSAWFCAVP